MFMLSVYFIIIILFYLFDLFYRAARKMLYNRKIKSLLASICTKKELLYTDDKDILNMLALFYTKKGYKVKTTDMCGEALNGLILDDLVFVELWKNSIDHKLEIETAIKFSRCMQEASIHRGKLVTIGDFKMNTKLYCNKYVIECINGDTLLDMLKELRYPAAAQVEITG